MIKQQKTNNILIVSSHADDHISSAGTIFKLQEERGMVPFELVLTDSSKGQDFRAKKQLGQRAVKQMRQKELSVAAQFLGIRKTFKLSQADFGLERTPAVVFATAKVIREVQPQIIIINAEFDAHPDHRAAFRIALDAIKLASFSVDIEKMGQPWRVPVVLCVEQMLPDKIQLLVDITRFADKKQQLLKIYASQMSPKSMAFENGMMAVRGYHLRKPAGYAAEAFTLQNEFPILAFEESEGELL